jgi:hypothetical protein
VEIVGCGADDDAPKLGESLLLYTYLKEGAVHTQLTGHNLPDGTRLWH